MPTTCKLIQMNSDTTLAEVTFGRSRHVSTTVTHSAPVVAEWIDKTIQGCSGGGPCQRHLVGLEVACLPNGNIVLLHLCVGSRCLIYQLPHRDPGTSPPRELFAFLDDARFCFAGAGVDVVAYGLQREHGFSVRNTVDLGDLAASKLEREELRRAGLERLAKEVMGVEMDTPAEVQRSEWWQRELSQKQIFCASVLAFLSFELGRVLLGVPSIS